MQLHSRILLGMVVGAAAGLAVNALAPGASWVPWLVDSVARPAGEIFLRMLLMTVVPLVFASLVLGVAELGDLSRLGRLGGKTLACFLLSTGLAVVIGLVLVNLMSPGAAIDADTRDALVASFAGQVEAPPAEGFGIGFLVDIVPRNPVQAAASGDMLSIIFFALVFGAALATLPRERAEPMLAVIRTLGDVVIRIIDFAMRLAPYGVFALVFSVTARFGWELLLQVGVYVLVVLLGLLLHAVVGLSAILRLLGAMSPLFFWRRVRASLVTAFATSSSNATLPTSIRVAEAELKLPPSIAGFVLPLGATMNMNGTALYEGITVLFLAEVFGVDLSLLQQLTVALLAVVTAIGAAGIPGGSLPLIMVVLATVGVPPESIAIILGVDRILDMARTVLNVAGDLVVAVVVARSEER